jgi:hypothetical protein
MEPSWAVATAQGKKNVTAPIIQNVKVPTPPCTAEATFVMKKIMRTKVAVRSSVPVIWGIVRGT